MQSEDIYPYNELNIIHNDDCLNVLPKIRSESVHCILTDPPYGISSNIKIRRGSNPGKFKGKDINYNFGSWDFFKSDDEFWKFTKSWIEQCVRILVPGGTFVSFFDRDKINEAVHFIKDLGFKGVHYLCWIKSNPVPQVRKVKWANGWEIAFLLIKNGGVDRFYNWEEGHHADYWITPIVGGKERTEHPTQKPIIIGKDIVRWWSPEDGVILDPFSGSGTFLLAAKEQGRKYIGIESNEKWYKIATKRVERELLKF